MKKVILLILILFGININAEEYIQNFQSRIDILEDGNIHVTETITINVENHKILYGINRNIPTYSPDSSSANHSEIQIINITLDDDPVYYRITKSSNQINVKIGDADVILSHGLHKYQIQYYSSNQIYHTGTNDKLYWNVTGNEWEFPIRKASTEIYFQSGKFPTPNKLQAWTGKAGETYTNFQYKVYKDHIRFETTKNLNIHEGFTIQVHWAKGVIRFNNTNLSNNFEYLNLPFILTILLLLYYLIVWFVVGIDPAKGQIFAKYYPPEGMSPAAMRYIWKRKYDSKCFSVAIINLAIKKYITLKQESFREYIISKNKNSRPIEKLSRGENQIFAFLFGSDRDSYDLGDDYDNDIHTSTKVLTRSLNREYKESTFKNNRKFWIIGNFISILILFLNWYEYKDLIIHDALGDLMIGVVFVILTTVERLTLKLILAYQLFLALFIIIFGLPEIQQNQLSHQYFLFFFTLPFLNLIFRYLIESPTKSGRKLLDEIECFKLYLLTAEEDRIKINHPPQLNSDLFEKYLPYAIALDVETEWSEQFNHAMNHLHQTINSYQPEWYIGSSDSNYEFTSNFSSIAQGLVIATNNSSRTQSYDGFSNGGDGGDGGFSGGGGGGGGGSGW